MYVITDRERENAWRKVRHSKSVQSDSETGYFGTTPFLVLQKSHRKNPTVKALFGDSWFFGTHITSYKTNFGGYIKWHHVSR